MGIKLEAGQWYRNRDGFVRHVIGRGPLVGIPNQDAYSFLVLHDPNASGTSWSNDEGFSIDGMNEDLVEHLPCCDGFDWKPEPQCRPFLNSDEFAPHRDRWVVNGSHPDFWRVERYNNDYVFINGRQVAYCDLYDNYRFEDGTQCGIVVGQ